MADVRERDPRSGAVKTSSSSAGRERRERARAREQWARTILENDPTVESMSEARERARELESETRDFRGAVDEGLVDPKTGEPTRRARRARSRARRPSGRARAKGSRRAPATRSGKSFVRQTARTVAAPFGSGLSAGWTLFQGGLSLVLLYVVMRDADAIGDLVEGVSTGLRRFSDPYTALLPRSDELAAATSSTRRSLAAPKRKQKPAGRRGGYSRGGLPGPGSPNDPRIRR